MSRAPRKPKKQKGAGLRQEKAPLLHCSHHHTKALTAEVTKAGLALKEASFQTQRSMLLKTLQYMGPRGLNTPEGTALGYMRIATRIQELEETWVIASLREAIIGDDGLVHRNVARYILMGRRSDFADRQLDLGWEG